MNEIINASPFLQGYFMTLVTIVGMVVGSFLNVVALRLLSEESFVFPPSKCPKCKTPIKWYDNIPVFSYIFLLKGKCRSCQKKISLQYPIVEAITGSIFLAVFLHAGFSLNTLFLWFLSSCMIVMTLTDLKEKVIFDITSIPLIPIGLAYTFFDLGNSGLGQTTIELMGINLTLNSIFISAVIGAIAGAAFFELVSGLGYLMVGQRAFGEGDTIIAAALGAWFGWKAIIAIILMSFVFQLIIGLPLIMMNMYKDKDHKSLFATFMLIFSVFVPFIGQLTGISQSLTGALFFAILAFGIAGYGVVVILKRAKERENFTFLPFGPALILGGFAIMFFQDQIISYISNIY